MDGGNQGFEEEVHEAWAVEDECMENLHTFVGDGEKDREFVGACVYMCAYISESVSVYVLMLLCL